MKMCVSCENERAFNHAMADYVPTLLCMNSMLSVRRDLSQCDDSGDTPNWDGAMTWYPEEWSEEELDQWVNNYRCPDWACDLENYLDLVREAELRDQTLEELWESFDTGKPVPTRKSYIEF
jgi:hypothetical protein